MACHIKKGDEVIIVAGDHKNAHGKVLKVDTNKGTVLIQGHNLAKKHVRPSRQNPQGGRVDVEQPIHISNVMLRGKDDKGKRVKFVVDKNGNKKRMTVDGKEISTVKHS